MSVLEPNANTKVLKMRLIVSHFIILFVFSLNTFGELDKNLRCDQREPRFFLKIFVESEGSISKKHLGKMIYLYMKPGGENDIFKKVKITASVKEYLNLLESFDSSKTPKYTDLITSHEKEGDFFKVCFKGKYAWLKQGGVVVFYTLEEYLKEIGDLFMFRSDTKTQFFDRPLGRSISYSMILKRAPGVNPSDEPSVKYLEHKIIQDKLWVRIQLDKNIYKYVKNGDTLRKSFKPFSVWFQPYQEDGSVNGWEYPYNDVQFYKKN